MPVPTYDQFIEPILRILAQNPNGMAAKDVHEAAADRLGLTTEDKLELLPGGSQAVSKNRAGWAHDRLKRAGLSSSLRRGFWQLTPSGMAFAANNSTPLSQSTLWEFATAHNDIRLRTAVNADHPSIPSQQDVPTLSTVSPDERLEQALAEIRESVVAELLETLHRVSPTFFETLVLDVLHKLGYGTSRADLTRVGKAGDGGIDGVISLDRLGLEKVYVQAKRWQQAVGRPEVQAFYGALAGQRANKGVFITTSSFTAQAIEFANSVERIVLVSGSRLAELMIDNEVGVSLRPLSLPKVDGDYFED